MLTNTHTYRGSSATGCAVCVQRLLSPKSRFADPDALRPPPAAAAGCLPCILVAGLRSRYLYVDSTRELLTPATSEARCLRFSRQDRISACIHISANGQSKRNACTIVKRSSSSQRWSWGLQLLRTFSSSVPGACLVTAGAIVGAAADAWSGLTSS